MYVDYAPSSGIFGLGRQTSKEMAFADGVCVAQCSKRPCIVASSYGAGSFLAVALNFSRTTSLSASSTKSMSLIGC